MWTHLFHFDNCTMTELTLGTIWDFFKTCQLGKYIKNTYLPLQNCKNHVGGVFALACYWSRSEVKNTKMSLQTFHWRETLHKMPCNEPRLQKIIHCLQKYGINKCLVTIDSSLTLKMKEKCFSELTCLVDEFSSYDTHLKDGIDISDNLTTANMDPRRQKKTTTINLWACCLLSL